MNPSLKKALSILALLVVTGLLGFGIYYMFFRSVVEPGKEQTASSTQNGLPTSGAAGPRVGSQLPGGGQLPQNAGSNFPSEEQRIPRLGGTSLIEDAPRTVVIAGNIRYPISPAPGLSGAIRTYNPNDGKFYRILDDGTQVPISDRTFYNIDSVTWAKKSDKAIITYPDGTKTYNDLTNDQQVTLPKHWEDFNFSPQDDRIVAKSVGNNESNRFIVVANPDGSNPQPVEEMGNNQDKVHTSWSPNNQIVAYAKTGDPLGYDREAIVLVGQNKENFKNLIVEGRDFLPNWSPSGNQILYSAYNSNAGYHPLLWISGSTGDSINANRRQLRLETWADKCTWQNETTVYCGVPRSLPNGAGLQRDIADVGPDFIYKIDLRTGQQTNLGQPDGGIAVGQINVAGDGHYAYITDRKTGSLIRFRL